MALPANARRHSAPWLLQASVALLLIGNTTAIAADLGIMADVVRRLVGGPHFLFVLLFGTICVAMQVLLDYARYVAILKWTTLALFAYVAVVLAIKVPWHDAASGMVPPGTGAISAPSSLSSASRSARTSFSGSPPKRPRSCA
jgi:Mn2+/Fe2+ NRAMP family transporter